MISPDLLDPGTWCALSFHDQRAALADAIREGIGCPDVITNVRIEAGSAGTEYDLVAAVETDVGTLRTPLWSHARATIFCDPSVHEANRKQLAPGLAIDAAIEELRSRLAVPFVLEARGLTITMTPESGVQRTWTAERSLFRNRTAVTREDLVTNAAPDLDVRDLLAHFYTGPSLRLVGEDGQAFLLPAGAETEGRLVSLCSACSQWQSGEVSECPGCGAPTDVVIAARPTRR
ncbi:MAG TPA: hypothetical protein VFI91_11000 [Longimicrobiaceae bacterium]|nr:hypothetical protein [Longimicrobiaceae bacterium]